MGSYSATYFTPEDREGKAVQVTVWPNELDIRIEQSALSAFRWRAQNILPVEDKTAPLYLKCKQGEAFSYLKFEDIAILDALNQSPAFKHVFTPSKLWLRVLVGFLLISVLLLAITAASIYFLAPKIIEKVVDALPVATEVKLGDQLFEQTKTEFIFNEEQTKVAQQFFDSLRFESRYPIRVHVVKSNELNAFAMPGGHIVIYDSILRTLHNSNELAGLLAHEYAHITKHHSTRTLVQMMGTYGVLSFIFGDVSGVSSAIVARANELLNMSYSRAFEQEADREGVKLLSNSGIDPYGMVQLLERLKAAETTDVPPFLSTHPLTEHRIEVVKKEIAKYPKSIQANFGLDELFLQLQ